MKNLKATVALVAILAPLATFSPQSALAQERHRMGPGGDGGGQPQAAAPAATPAPQAAPAERHRMGPGGQQGQSQGRGDGGGRFGGDRGDRGGRFGGQAAGQTPQPQAPAQPQGRAQYQGGQYQGRSQVQGQPQYQGQRPDQYRGQNQYQGQGQYQGRQDRGQRNYDNRAPGQAFAPGVNGGRDFNRNQGYDRGGNAYRGDNRYRGGDNYNRGGQRFAYGGRDYFRFRSDPYIWPRGYSSRSWGVRQILPSFFLMDRYYIDNFYDYGFDQPPYGYRWVRVGDDALLVNVYTGQIADVVPGVFYD